MALIQNDHKQANSEEILCVERVEDKQTVPDVGSLRDRIFGVYRHGLACKRKVMVSREKKTIRIALSVK